MRKLTKLKQEHFTSLLFILDLYASDLHSYQEPEKEDLKTWVDWLYTSAGLTPPEKIIVTSSLKDAAFLYEGSEASKLGRGVYTEIAKIIEPYCTAVGDAEGLDSLDKAVDWDVQRYVTRCIFEESVMLAGSQLTAFLGYHVNARDLEWLAVLDFYSTIEVFKDDFIENYKKIRKLGIFDTRLFEKVCIIVLKPEYLKELTYQYRSDYVLKDRSTLDDRDTKDTE